jgi:hypothetical protein
MAAGLSYMVQVAGSATSWSLVQRSPNEDVCLPVWDLETTYKEGIVPIRVAAPHKKCQR